jgi:hypothetical protein
MSAAIHVRVWANGAKTGIAKANATTAAQGSASNVWGGHSAATKTASGKATAAESTTATSSVETTATTKAAAATAAAGPCRLTEPNKRGAD